MNEEDIERMKKEMEQYGSPLAAATAQLHEMYVQLQKSGFSRKEALYMITKLFVLTITSGPES